MAGFSADINFQPASAATPAGTIADAGQTYGSRNGQTYGWNRDNAAATRDRDNWTSPDQSKDTLAHLGGRYADQWEIAVPNGTYQVKIVAGDPSYLDSSYNLALEGRSALSGNPSASNRWIESTGFVGVSDGKLTLSIAGGWNNKINRITISEQQIIAGGLPTGAANLFASSAEVGTAWMTWRDNATNETGFYLQQSTDSVNYATIQTLAANSTSGWVTNLAAGDYWFRVVPFNAAGTGTPVTSAKVSVRGNTWTPPVNVATPSSPSALSGSATTPRTASLNWIDNSANETGFKVQESTDGWSFYEVATVAANATSYTRTGINGNADYWYRIIAFNNAGNSNATAALKIRTIDAVTPVGPVTPVNPGAPRTPTSVQATATGSNQAIISWVDNASNEVGFYVEESTDGVNFSALGQTWANVTAYTRTGLQANRTYYYRVVAYNGAGNSAPSTSGSVFSYGQTLPPVNPNYFDGVTANPEYRHDQVRNAMADLGIKAVRLWVSVDWNSPANNRREWDILRQYRQAGYMVVACLHDKNVPSPDAVRNWFNWTRNNTDAYNTVDRWEILNEPNLPLFFNGNLNQYVNNVLKPSYETLKAAGETVIGAGLSWNLAALREVRDLGYLNYVDYANYHAYGYSAQDQIQLVTQAKAIFAGKPLMMTEWNLQMGGYGVNAWAAELAKVRNWVTQNVESAFYYHILVKNTPGGAAGLMSDNGSGTYQRNALFYDLYESWNPG